MTCSRAFARCLGLLAIGLAIGLAAALVLPGGARVHAQDAARPVVVAMESSLGIGGAAKVRAQLRRQSGLPILSVSEAHAQNVRLGVMLVVEFDRGKNVTVLYFDQRGVADVLSAPVAPDSPDVTGIVATLASALLQRHPAPAAGDNTGRDGPTRDANLEIANASRALYAALGRIGVVHRRTGRLSAEDF